MESYLAFFARFDGALTRPQLSLLLQGLLPEGAAYAFARNGQAWMQAQYIKPPPIDAGDNFGWAVAISSDGRTQAASLPGDDSNATGVNGNADDASAPESGAVMVTFY